MWQAGCGAGKAADGVCVMCECAGGARGRAARPMAGCRGRARLAPSGHEMCRLGGACEVARWLGRVRRANDTMCVRCRSNVARCVPGRQASGAGMTGGFRRVRQALDNHCLTHRLRRHMRIEIEEIGKPNMELLRCPDILWMTVPLASFQ